MSVTLIALIMLLAVIILVPQRIRFALNEMFAFLDTPFRDLSAVTGGYIFNYPNRSRRILNSAGISNPPYFGKAIGTIIVTAVTLISLMADLELVILTLEGVGIGEKGKEIVSLMPLKPAECMAIALIGGAAMLGIVFFDYFRPVLLPDTMVWSRNIGKVLMLISAVMLIGAVIALGALAKFRASTIDYTIDKNISTMTEINQNPDASDDMDNAALSGLNSPLQSYIRTYLFVYIALLTLVNGILGFLVLSPFSGLFICFLLAILLAPVAVIYFISNMMHRLITLMFNIFVAVFNVIQGVFNGLSSIMIRIFNIDDTVQERNDAGEAEAGGGQGVGPVQEPQPLNNTNPNQPEPQEDRHDRNENHPHDNQPHPPDEGVANGPGDPFDPFNPII